MVTREVLLPVSFALMVRPGTGLHAVRRVATHPHAAAQCRRWLATVLPDAVVVPALSTAAAAAGLADGSAGHDAAIAAPIAAEHYRLEGRLDRDTAGRHVAQQRLDLGTVHGRKASARPTAQQQPIG
jgi:prephenate dehydratase